MDEEGFEDGTFNIHFRKISWVILKIALDLELTPRCIFNTSEVLMIT